jgi:hypothetical protein
MATQFQHSLSFEEIEGMRTQVLNILSNLNTNKHRIMTHDFRQLNNHLQYALNTLGNMHNILAVEQSDPYGSQQSDYSQVSGLKGKKVLYNPDGTTRIVDNSDSLGRGEDWEKQFDEGLLMRPPCFQIPPQNLTSIPRIRQASNHGHDMIKEL